MVNKYTALFIIPVTTLLIIFSKELVQVILVHHINQSPLFLILSVIPFFLVDLGRFALGGFFNGLGETKVTFKMTLLNFTVFVFLTPLLTKTYNVSELIIALLLSALASTILGAYISKTRF